MPASFKGGRRLLSVLFWTGVGLAPLAALALLLGQGGGPLRVAAVLAIVSVVLIGLSVTLRRDVDSVRLDMQETLLDEVDLLRVDVREEIATATRTTEAALRQEVETLRAQLDALRTHLQSAPSLEPEPAKVGPAVSPMNHGHAHAHAHAQAQAQAHAHGHDVVQHTEMVQVTTRQTRVTSGAALVDHAMPGGRARGTVYGARMREPAAAPEHDYWEPSGWAPAAPADPPTGEQPRAEAWQEWQAAEPVTSRREVGWEPAASPLRPTFTPAPDPAPAAGRHAAHDWQPAPERHVAPPATPPPVPTLAPAPAQRRDDNWDSFDDLREAVSSREFARQGIDPWADLRGDSPQWPDRGSDQAWPDLGTVARHHEPRTETGWSGRHEQRTSGGGRGELRFGARQTDERWAELRIEPATTPPAQSWVPAEPRHAQAELEPRRSQPDPYDPATHGWQTELPSLDHLPPVGRHERRW